MDVGSWLLQGFGYWSLEEKATGRFLGSVGVGRQPRFPENEIGWILQADAEGQGFGFEAATAARNWAYQTLGWTTLVSYIEPANTRSIALAERLGARRDDAAAKPEGDPDDLVYRHPSPEELR
jgi:RimJ/RimL family protein N-acetyltransferase